MVGVNCHTVFLNLFHFGHKLVVLIVHERDDRPLEDILMVEVAVNHKYIALQFVNALGVIFTECLFWLKYVEKNQENVTFINDNITSDVMKAWRGVAFEQVCWQHIPQMKRALEIGGVRTSVSAWNVPGTEQKAGVQIDLLIQRDDNIVNLCEMKFYGTPLSIDKEEETKMLHRVEMLKKTLSAKQTVHLTLVTTFGLVHGKHSGKVQKIITIDDFFT